MNQNGDPSQCWIKVKPDGRVDVFAGTADIGNGSKTIQSQIVAETIGVPYDWITYDNSNTDSSPVCTGTFASRATFVAGKAAEKAALQVKQKILEIAGKEMEIDPADLEIIDGEVIAKGAPQTKLGVGDVAAAATWGHGELITGTGAQLKPYAAIVDPETGRGRPPAPLRDLVRVVCGGGRGRRRDGRGARHPPAAVLRRRPCAQPVAGRGADRGGAMMGLGLGILENCYPYYPSVEPPRRLVRLVPRAGHGGHAADRHDHDREPLRRRAVRREGHRRDGEQPAAAGDRRGRSTTRSASGSRSCRSRPSGCCVRSRRRREPTREGKKVVFDEELPVNAVSSGGMRFGGPGLTSPFRTWNGVDRHTLFPGWRSTRSAASR